MGKKNRKPKIKMRSYGEGKELPIVKSKQGLFKKPEFYLADQKYDNLGHGDFEGQYTGKLEGPSQRAIKGKGKKAKNVRVHSEGGDPIFLQDTSPMKQKYSSQSGMESAVKRWQSPHKLTGDPDKSTFNYADKNRAKTEKEKFGVTREKGQEKQIAKEKKKADKEAYKKTDEFKEKRAKQQDTVQAVGRAMMAYAGLQPGEAGESATEKLKKQKAPSEKASNTKTNLHIDDSGDVLKSDSPKFKFRKGNQGESKEEYEAAYDAAYDKFKEDKGSSLKRKIPKQHKKAIKEYKKEHKKEIKQEKKRIKKDHKDYKKAKKAGTLEDDYVSRELTWDMQPALERRGDIKAMSSMMRKIKNPQKKSKKHGQDVDDQFFGKEKGIDYDPPKTKIR
jgi:hypothetical protein